MNAVALTGLGVLLFFAALMVSLVALALRHRQPPAPEPNPEPQQRRPPRQLHYRLSQERREQKRALILAALLAGVEPQAIAELLRGNAQHNRRIVSVVRRLNAQRLELDLEATA